MPKRKKTIPQERARRKGIEKISTSMRVPVDLWREVKIVAAMQGTTVESLIASAVKRYLSSRQSRQDRIVQPPAPVSPAQTVTGETQNHEGD